MANPGTVSALWSQRESVDCGMPTSPAKAVADTLSGPTSLRTMLDFKPGEYFTQRPSAPLLSV